MLVLTHTIFSISVWTDGKFTSFRWRITSSPSRSFAILLGRYSLLVLDKYLHMLTWTNTYNLHSELLSDTVCSTLITPGWRIHITPNSSRLIVPPLTTTVLHTVLEFQWTHFKRRSHNWHLLIVRYTNKRHLACPHNPKLLWNHRTTTDDRYPDRCTSSLNQHLDHTPHADTRAVVHREVT